MAAILLSSSTGRQIPFGHGEMRGSSHSLEQFKTGWFLPSSERACLFWKTNSKADSGQRSYLCFVIFLEQKCLGTPKEPGRLVSQINVKSAAKGSFRSATLGGGDGCRAGRRETGIAFFSHPAELDCSGVILARWQKAATGDFLIALRDSVWLSESILRV